jgi:hypothetical protein
VRDNIPDIPRNPLREPRPAKQQLHDVSRHHPINPKHGKNQTPQITCNRAVKKKMSYRFPIPFTHATPINDHQPPLAKILCCKNFPHSSRPKKETNLRWGFRFPNLFPWENLSRDWMQHCIEGFYFKQLVGGGIPAHNISLTLTNDPRIDQIHKLSDRFQLSILNCTDKTNIPIETRAIQN